jgi:glycosyltransferase involved in cell wall biosynthesis
VTPEVSCVLATGGRRRFLPQALRCFLSQTFEARELVVVDDGEEPAADLVPADPRIRYLRMEPGQPLGAKLNAGVEAARGVILQKLDDDDWYHPRFLESTVAAVRGARGPAVAAFDSFLVLIAATGALKESGPGWCAGGTLCFPRAVWERTPFRPVPAKVDWWLLRDHGREPVRVHAPGRYVLVRHGEGHVWTRMGNVDVTGWFARRPDHPRALEQVMPSPADRAFYASLRAAPAPAPAAAR